MDSTIIIGDVRETLGYLDDCSIQTCITSPPYWGLRDYGTDNQIGLEPTLDEYIEQLTQVFDDVRRVLKNDGVLWLNLGDTYAGKNNSRASANGRAGYGTPREGTFSRMADGLKPKDLIGVPWRVAFALQQAGWYLRQDIIWAKPNPLPESVKDRCTKSHEYIFMLTKSPHYYFNSDAIKTPSKKDWGKRNRQDGKYHNEGTGLQPHTGLEANYPMANRRDVWTIPVRPFKGAHFAVMPEALVEPCVLAASRENDTILDPFAGAGTVGVVAKRHDRNFIGIELNPEYAAIATDRINNTK